jgi:hypothetical protein
MSKVIVLGDADRKRVREALEFYLRFLKDESERGSDPPEVTPPPTEPPALFSVVGSEPETPPEPRETKEEDEEKRNEKFYDLYRAFGGREKYTAFFPEFYVPPPENPG